MHYYSFIYGLNIRLNHAVPGVVVTAAAPAVLDLDIVFGAMPCWFNRGQAKKAEWYVSAHRAEDGAPGLIIWQLDDGNHYHARYADGTEFLIAADARHIWAEWPSETLTLEDTATYLLGPIMGFVLLLRGSISLHASAIAVGAAGLALVGPAGAGKSTTAAAFADLGYRILAEDVLTIDDQGDVFLIKPAYPCIRLWPASVKALYGPEADLPKLTPSWDKCYLDLNQEQYQFGKASVQLTAIYILKARVNHRAAPYIKQLSHSDGLMALIANTYSTYLMDKQMRARGFNLLSRVLAGVPVKEVVPHEDPARIAQLCQVLIADLVSVDSTAARESPINV